jgi:hypothetical protein
MSHVDRPGPGYGNVPPEDDAGLFEPPAPRLGGPERPPRPGRHIFRRGPWEMAASIIIALGVLMLLQPFALWAFTWSFLVTLAGTVMFIIVSHFPE